MLQDDSRELSRWLASKPDARLHAREAAAAIASAPAAPTGEREALHEVALRINRLILMSAAKARQTADDPPEDRITDADIDRAEAELLAHIRAAVSAPVAVIPVERIERALSEVQALRDTYFTDSPCGGTVDRCVYVFRNALHRGTAPAPVAAPPAASGVEAQWVETAMNLADDYARAYELHGSEKRYGRSSLEYVEKLKAEVRAAREDLRAHLSTALTGAAKEVK